MYIVRKKRGQSDGKVIIRENFKGRKSELDALAHAIGAKHSSKHCGNVTVFSSDDE